MEVVNLVDLRQGDAAAVLATLTAVHWFEIRDGDPRLVALYGRHYTANPTVSVAQRRRYGVSGVGESLCLLTVDSQAAFIWVKNTMERMDRQVGVQCSFFRNESDALSSDLICEADELAWQKWPGERHWTYIDRKGVEGRTNKGKCFLHAGWRRYHRKSQGGLLILERFPLFGAPRGNVTPDAAPDAKVQGSLL